MHRFLLKLASGINILPKCIVGIVYEMSLGEM